MATGTAPPPTSPAGPPAPPPTRDETIIDGRLRKTQRQLKAVDLAARLLFLVIAALLYLLVAAVFDHWIVPGGLGRGMRVLLFLGLVGGVGVYFARAVLPLFLHRINPVFAARVIEEGRPSLKTGLVNFLFLRRQRDELERDKLGRLVFRGLERTAAAEVARIPADASVDRSAAIRLGYVLAVVTALACLYLVLSPKSPMASAARVVMPWADIAAPTRVTIQSVRPGDHEAFQGDTVAVSAEVKGLRPDEPVELHYTTADGQSVDQVVPMSLPEGGYRHQGELPPGGDGLQQNVSYFLTAGDYRTREFTLEVAPALTIVVDRLDYDYPDYTGIRDRTDRQTGDIRAVEGTRVRVHAVANRPIRRATIEIDGDSRQRRTMADEDNEATGEIALAMREDGSGRPAQESYQVRFTDPEGRENRRPTRYEIEVVPDLPPNVGLADPPPERVKLAANGTLELRVRAQDPDFALRRVALRAESDGEKLAIRPLLDKPRPGAGHEGPFEAVYRFRPAKLGLQPGQEVIYWAEADDNKENARGPAPNHRETPRRWIEITPPEGRTAPEPNPQPGEEAAEPQPRAGEEGQPEQGDQGGAEMPGDQGGASDQPQEGATQEQNGGEGEQGAGEQGQPSPSGEGAGQEGESTDQGNAGQEGAGAKPSAQGNPSGEGPDQPGTESTGPGKPGGEPTGPREPIDPKTNPGDAIEQILEHRAAQEPKPGDADGGKPTDHQPPEGADGQPKDGTPDGSASDSSNSDSPPSGEPTGEKPAGTKPAVEPAAPKGEEPRPDGTTDSAKPEGDRGPDGQKPDRDVPKGECPNCTDGSCSDCQGKGGAGGPRGDTTGPPEAQEKDVPRDNHQAPDQGERPADNSENPESPSISPRQSDSPSGETAGDRSGGGEEGGGQDADQPGQGNPGSKTPSDQGGAPSSQQGPGPTGSRPGEEAPSDHPTGVPGEKEGPGSTARPDESGSKPGGGTPGDERPEGAEPQPGMGQGKTPGEGQQTGGGLPPDHNPPDDPSSGPLPEPPAIHDEYAKEQTVLALEHLEDQLAEEDPEVLDRLGWTREEAERFARNVREMMKAAEQDGPQGEEAQQRLDEWIRGLGLRPHSTGIGGDRSTAEELPGVRDSRRFEPPPDWAEHIRRYRDALSRGSE